MNNKSFIMVLFVGAFMLVFGSTMAMAAGGPACVPDPNCCPGGTAKSSDCCPGGTTASADCCPDGAAKTDKAGTSANCQPDPGCCDNSTKSSSKSKSTIKKTAPSKSKLLQKTSAKSES